MAFIIKGGHRDFPKPKIKRFLAIGTGESTSYFIDSKKNIPDEYIKFGMHRAFPYLYKNSNIQLDYWTWVDPDAAIDGLELYEKLPVEKLPTIVIPQFLENSKACRISAKHSRVAKDTKIGNTYDSLLEKALILSKLHIISNAKNAGLEQGTPEYVTNAAMRFQSTYTIFGSVSKGSPRFHLYAKSENRFTSGMLPVCNYLGASEVYNLGFDNKGKRIVGGSSMSTNPEMISKSLELFKKWKVDWAPYHKMEIFSAIPDKFTNINSILGFKEL
jgi:hypothetical protein